MSGTASAEDPRLVRSRQALLDAVAALLEERDVVDISVTELAAAAGMSRPTFYQHFADVPEAAAAAAARRIADTFARADERYADRAREDFVRGTLDEVVGEMDAHRALYRRVLAGPSSRTASDLVIRYVTDRMRERVLGGVAEPGTEDRLAVIGAGITWLMVQWVQTDGTGRNEPQATARRLAELLLALLPGEAGR